MKKKITAILVDDEANSNKVLSSLLNKFCPEIEICGQAQDEKEAYSLIAQKSPELVFLDVQLSPGSGFNLLNRFDELPFEVIFVTGFDQYAINAIKFSALDYLLKPVEVEDLVKAVQKAIKKCLSKENSQPQIINLLRNIQEEKPERTLAAHKNEKVIFIRVDNICAVEADSRYSHIQTINGEKYTLSKTLKEFEDYMTDDPSFIRINRSTIINTKYIRHYSKGDPCTIEMQNEMLFEISRRKKQEVLEKLKKSR